MDKQTIQNLEQETREIVLSRDNFRCVVCGVKGVDVHEIIPRSALGKRKYYILFAEKNRVCLCRKHHKEAHNAEMRSHLIELLAEKYKYVYNEDEYKKYLKDNDLNNG